MPLREPLWVAIDFGADHRVLRSFVPPAEDPLLWEGPFETWGEAKRFICSVGAAEAKEIATKTAWWRAAKLVDVLEDDDAPA